MTLPKVHPLADVAASMGMTTRFLRDYINKNSIEHLRIGNGPNARIKFTNEQVDKLHASFAPVPEATSITTGRKRRAS